MSSTAGGTVGDLRRRAGGVQAALAAPASAPASPSSVVSRSPWSVSTSRVSPVGLPSSSRTGASTGAISRLKRPSSTATRAFCCDARPNSSRSSRVSAAVLRDAVGAGELVGHVEVSSRRSARGPGPGRDVGAERDPRHHLDAAGDAGVDDAGVDEPGDEVGRLLRGAALRVDGRACRLLGEAREQPGPAYERAGLLAGLRDAAADDLLDEAGVDAGAVEQRAVRRPRVSWACRPARKPRRLPIGVRTASTITGLPHAGLKVEHVLIWRKRVDRSGPDDASVERTVCHSGLERVPLLGRKPCDRWRTHRDDAGTARRASTRPTRTSARRPSRSSSSPSCATTAPVFWVEQEPEAYAGFENTPGLLGRSASTPMSRRCRRTARTGPRTRTARSSASPPDMTRDQVELQGVMLINQDPPDHTRLPSDHLPGLHAALDRRPRGRPRSRGPSAIIEEASEQGQRQLRRGRRRRAAPAGDRRPARRTPGGPARSSSTGRTR